MLNWKRGINTNSKYKPDAEMDNLSVEFDMGTEKQRQVQRQAKRYDDYKGTVLWVFQDTNRFNWITEVANHSNTLVMLAGNQEVYDLGGHAMSIENLRSLV